VKILKKLEVLKKFNSIVKPIFEKIHENSLEINYLAKLRYILLPKLMSGDIDVSEVEI